MEALFHPSKAKLAKTPWDFLLSASAMTFAFPVDTEEKSHNPPNTLPIVSIVNLSRAR